MKIDTHTHLLLKKNSKPDWNAIDFHFKVAKTHGLDVVCITEHIDAVYFSDLYRGLFEENRLGGEILGHGIIKLPNSLIMVLGTEVPLRGGGEVGLHAEYSLIKKLKTEKDSYTIDEIYNVLSDSGVDFVLIGNEPFG